MSIKNIGFKVKTKYPLSIFKDSGLECSWNTVKVGWNLKHLTIDEIGQFALSYLANHPNLINSYISELIFGIKDYTTYEVDKHLKRLFISLHLNIPEEGSLTWHQESRKWRFCILNTIVNNITNNKESLETVERIHRDFGYPNDMAIFLDYYIFKSNDDGTLRLKGLIKDFLGEERALIESGGLSPDDID